VTQRSGSRGGFTFVEALLSIVTLGMAAVAISGAFATALQASDDEITAALFDEAVRSKMEELIATQYWKLGSGTQKVTIEGNDYTLYWYVKNYDVDGDGSPEWSAKEIVVSLEDSTASTVVVYNWGNVGKI